MSEQKNDDAMEPTVEIVSEKDSKIEFVHPVIDISLRDYNNPSTHDVRTPCPSPSHNKQHNITTESIVLTSDVSHESKSSDINNISTENITIQEINQIETETTNPSQLTSPELSSAKPAANISTPEKLITDSVPNFQAPQITYQGWLKKKKPSGFMRNWKKRWCVMFDTGLFRYYSEGPNLEGKTEEKYRKGKGDVYFLDLKVTGQDGNEFWIGTTKRMWKFQANSVDEASQWLSQMTEPFKQEKEQFERECNGAILEEDDVCFNDSNTLQRPPKVSTFYRAPSISRKASFKPYATFDRITTEYTGDVSPKEYRRTASCPVLFDDDDYTMEIQQEGWLQKQATSSFGYWNRRWCVLYKNGTFKYYNSPKKEQKKNNKRTLDFTKVIESGISGREFWVTTKERKWVFRATNFVLASEWLNSILSPEHLDSTLALFPVEHNADEDYISVWKVPTPELTPENNNHEKHLDIITTIESEEKFNVRASVSYVS